MNTTRRDSRKTVAIRCDRIVTTTRNDSNIVLNAVYNCAGRNNSLFILTVNKHTYCFQEHFVRKSLKLSNMIRMGFTRNAGCGARVTNACEC